MKDNIIDMEAGFNNLIENDSLTEIFENLPGLYLILSPDLKIIAATEAYLKSTFKKREHILGKDPFSVFPAKPGTPEAKTMDSLKASWNKVLRTGLPDSLDVQRYDMADLNEGNFLKPRYWQPVNTPVLDSDNKVKYIIHQANDITHQIESEEQYKNLVNTSAEQLKNVLSTKNQAETERQKLYSLFMQAPAIVAVLRGKEHVFELANPKYMELVGPNRDIVGKTVKEALPEIGNQGFLDILDTVYETGTPFIGNEIIIKLKKFNDDELHEVFLNFVYQPTLDESAKVDGIFVHAVDVTEHVKIRKQIQESEEKYRSLFITMDQGFCIIELLFDTDNKPVNYRFIEINPVFEKQTGIKDAIGKTVKELVPDLETRWFEIYGQVALTGVPVRFIEGSQAMGRWFEVNAFRIGKSGNNKVALLFTDISQRIDAEKALKESEERFRALADEAPVFIFLADENSNVHFWNKTYLDFTGLSLEDSLLDSWTSQIHPDDLSSITNTFLEAAKNGKPYSGEWRLKSKTGEYRWILFQGTPRYDAEGKFIGYMGSGSDIHLNKQTENILKESEGRFRAMAEDSDIFIALSDQTSNAVYFNQAWSSLTGREPKDLMEFGWADLIHEEDRQNFIDLYLTAFKNKEPWKGEFRILNKEGKYRWLLATGTLRLQADGSFAGYISSSIDITDRKEFEKALELKNKELKRINNDLDNFIYTASHDLKAPISNLEGLLNAFVADYQFDEDQQEIINMMFQSTERFKSTIQDLTDISKVQASETEDMEILGFEKVFEEVKKDINNLISNYLPNIFLNLEVEEIHFSRKNLRSIIYNLISNALKYSSAERPLHVKISTRKENGFIVLEVADNGLGLSKENQKKIFGMFKRAHQHVEGSGIGLYMIKKILENAGGKIEVESELHVGTTFKAYFKS